MDKVAENDLESGTNEKDPNANEAKKNLINGISGTENADGDSVGKERNQSSVKVNDTELLANRRVEKKLSGDETVAAKSTKGSDAKSSGKDVKINGEDTKGESVSKEGKRKRRISRFVAFQAFRSFVTGFIFTYAMFESRNCTE